MNELQFESLVPSSEVAEQSVIGGLLIDNSRIVDVCELITAEDFYYAQNRLIFRVIEILTEHNQPTDPVNIISQLEHQQKLEEAGGMAYIGEIANNTPSAANVLAYAETVKAKSNERAVLVCAGNMESAIRTDEGTSEERINNALAFATNFNIDDAKEKSLDDVIKQVIYDVEHRFNNKNVLTGLSTGFKAIDQRLNGLQKTDLMVLAARPSMGKTTLAMNCATNAAINGQNGAVLVFSLEMSAEQLMMKNACQIGNISLQRLRDGGMTDEEWPRFAKAIKKLKESSFVIDDRPALSIQQVRAKALKTKRKHGSIKLVVVDYMQLLKDKTARSRTEEVGSISRSLKALAKEIEAPVIALSQLNRKCEERTDKRPKMSDLRDSGEVEQDADIIQFIYRDVVYNEQTQDENVAEVITAKFRNGETGRDFLFTRLDKSRFEDMNYDARQLPDRKSQAAGFEYKSAL